MTFWPKPPPVSRMMTRTRCSGMPSSREQKSRTSWGAWVAEWMVISPVVGEASTTMTAGLHRHRRVALLVDVDAGDVGGRGVDLLEGGRRTTGDHADEVRAVRLVDEVRRWPRRSRRSTTAGSGS